MHLAWLQLLQLRQQPPSLIEIIRSPNATFGMGETVQDQPIQEVVPWISFFFGQSMGDVLRSLTHIFVKKIHFSLTE